MTLLLDQAFHAQKQRCFGIGIEARDVGEIEMAGAADEQAKLRNGCTFSGVAILHNELLSGVGH